MAPRFQFRFAGRLDSENDFLILFISFCFYFGFFLGFFFVLLRPLGGVVYNNVFVLPRMFQYSFRCAASAIVDHELLCFFFSEEKRNNVC